MKSHQETFDQAMGGIIKQGKLSYIIEDGRKKCMYRLHDGDQVLKCAAGQLIPDEDYSEDFENIICQAKIIADVIEAQGHDISYVCYLQLLHDEALAFEHFIVMARGYAKKDNLEWKFD